MLGRKKKPVLLKVEKEKISVDETKQNLNIKIN